MANKLLSLLGVGFFVAGSAALVACSSSSAAPDTTGGGGSSSGAVSLNAIRMTTIHTSCAISASCHSGSNPAGFIDLSDSRSNADVIKDLKAMSSDDPTTPRAVPGQPDASLLYHKLTGDFTGLPCEKSMTCGTPMPQTGPKIPAAEVTQIHDWIAAGMPDN